MANGLPARSIRTFFARVLLNRGEYEAARVELRACEGEARAGGERDEADWAELLAEAAGPPGGVS